MSKVRVLVGTRKGAFVLTSDGKRDKWEISRPYFGGWEIYHVKGSPVDPNRIYVSQSNGWFGQIIQRSDDGGKTWNTPGGGPTTTPEGFPQGESNKFVYEGEAGKHLWYDGTPHPWEFKRVWHLEPSLTDPDMVYAGVEDAALFRTTDGGHTWKELPALRAAKGHLWQPGAGGMGLHTILLDKTNPNRIYVAISAAGVFRTDDAGKTWKPVTRGLKSSYELPDQELRGWPLRSPHRDAPVAPECVVHAETLGRQPQRRRRGRRGMRSAGICRPISGFRSTFTRTSRTPSTSSRSRATPSITPPTPSSGFTGAAPAATSGSRSRKVCRNAIATSTCCATRWLWTRSISAVCISAPPAGRCMHRLTPATTGRPSSTICQRCCPSRSRR